MQAQLIIQQMNVMRRNDDAMKCEAGIKIKKPIIADWFNIFGSP